MTAVATNLRRVSLSALYEPGYKWDGSCRCGANDWLHAYWKGGYQVTCALCGWWECAHTVKGVYHTSEGLWAGTRSKCRPPVGCPALAEGQGMGQGRPETNAKAGAIG